jgi:hypothetical protein
MRSNCFEVPVDCRSNPIGVTTEETVLPGVAETNLAQGSTNSYVTLTEFNVCLLVSAASDHRLGDRDEFILLEWVTTGCCRHDNIAEPVLNFQQRRYAYCSFAFDRSNSIVTVAGGTAKE